MDRMTPKERWIAVLSGKTPDRVPMDYWGTPEITLKLMQHFGFTDLWDLFKQLHIDAPVNLDPTYTGPPLAPGQDYYGCGLVEVDYGTGTYTEYVHHPLLQYDSIEEIEANYTWPSADWFDYSVLPQQLKGKEGYPVRAGGSEPFHKYARLRGVEQSFIDLAINPEMVSFSLKKIIDFRYEYTSRIYEAVNGNVTFSYVAEDFGSQEALLFSPDTIRRLFLPGMKRMADLVHEAGAYAFCHSDGAIRPIIPDLIGIGIDILNPIQWRCPGMEREGLKQDFGTQLVLHGGVDNQQTLAFGSVDDVQTEVRDNLAILGEGGGYILAPCHNIQAVSPVENVIAMYETGYTYGINT